MYEQTLKKHLDEIIDNLDVDLRLKDQYKDFEFVFVDKTLNSRSGVYFLRRGIIEVTQTKKHTNANQIMTCLHELAHHIDTVNRGTSDHSKEFYKQFALLIYSALDLGKVTYQDAINIVHANSDYRKVIKILENYEPKLPINKKPYELVAVNVKGLAEEDKTLQGMGYEWNQRRKCWFRNVLPDVARFEKETLANMGYEDVDLIDANLITIYDDDKRKLDKAKHLDELITKALDEWENLNNLLKRKVGTGSDFEDVRRSLDGSPIIRESNVEEWFMYDYITITGKIYLRQGKFINLDRYFDIYELDPKGNRVLVQRNVSVNKLENDNIQIIKKINI